MISILVIWLVSHGDTLVHAGVFIAYLYYTIDYIDSESSYIIYDYTSDNAPVRELGSDHERL